MKKILLLTVLFVAIVATSAFGLDITVSKDGQSLTTSDGKTHPYAGAIEMPTNDGRETVIFSIFGSADDPRIIAVVNHKPGSRPFAITITEGDLFKLFGDFDCDNTWEEVDPSTPIEIPECARARE